MANMSKIALGMGLAGAALFVSLALRDPLAAAALTPSQRAAGFVSAEIEVNGENCRFCRINVERTLKGIEGVKRAKADMAHHRARVVYDPKLVRLAALTAAIQGSGFSATLLSAPPIVPPR
jgi:copper chaperone CopZ